MLLKLIHLVHCKSRFIPLERQAEIEIQRDWKKLAHTIVGSASLKFHSFDFMAFN